MLPVRRTTAEHLCLESITKRFGQTCAVDRVSLEIAEGEFITILGPSGSGKTTLLMMIGGFEQPTDGRIILGGRAVDHLPPYRRNLGMVFQQYALFPHRTVAENVEFPLKMRGVPKGVRHRSVEETLDLMRLSGLGSRYPHQLSGGQQQRVALARALIFRPPLLLMDEPLSALDRNLRHGMQMEIKRIQRDLKITTLYVTHDQEEALVLSDRIVVMRAGRVEQVAGPLDLYSQPANRFVADFLGRSNIVQLSSSLVDGRWEGRTRNGRRLILPTTEGLSENAHVSLVIRPEKVRFFEDPVETDGAIYTLAGEVEDVAYVGEATNYVVRVDDELRILCKIPSRGGEHHARMGEMCRIGWRTEDSCILRENW